MYNEDKYGCSFTGGAGALCVDFGSGFVVVGQFSEKGNQLIDCPIIDYDVIGVFLRVQG